MKKTIFVIFFVYALVILGLLYFFLGAAVFKDFEPLQWQGIKTNVPPGFKVKVYQSKGWEVYSLSRPGTVIKIALKPEIDVFGLASYEKKVVFEKRENSPQPAVFYIVEGKEPYTLVFAANRDNKTVYLSITTFSLYLSRFIMDKMLADFSFNQGRIEAPAVTLPLKLYIIDWIIAASLLLPLLIMIPIFYFSGKRPGIDLLPGETLLYEEKSVIASFRKGWVRSNTFCCLVLTNLRLLVFYFGRKKVEIDLQKERSALRLEGKKIILEKAGMKTILRPGDIENWKSNLRSHGF
ncbi:MAG: hypothetical protein KAW12_18850 [Candidatus Aminicenantes bacterium]|nr:hypothetical protein [Candidatus Aminicenantes bacterium]